MERFVLQWHITHLCNLRCRHCYQEEYNNHMSAEDFYNAIEKFDRYVKDKNVPVQINLTGGEPLCHPQFFEFAKAVKKRGYRLGILTNGTIIDKEVAKKLSELKPVFVQVSLDGTEKTHDYVRGEGALKKALEGIDNLKKEKIKTLVSFTAQKSNYRDFPRLAKVCRKHKVDKLWWDRVVTEDKSMALNTKEFKTMVKKCNRLKKRYGFLKEKSMISNQRALQFLGTNDCGYNCSAGKSLLVFLADGSVMPCRRLPFTIGNIKEKELSEIMDESNLIKDLTREITSLKCLGCDEFLRCRGGAKCVTYAQTGKLFDKDVNCFYR